MYLVALGTYEGGLLSYKVAEEAEPYYGGSFHKGAVRFVGWNGPETVFCGSSDESCSVHHCRKGDHDLVLSGNRGCVGVFAGPKNTVITVGTDGHVQVLHDNVKTPVIAKSFAQRNKQGKPLHNPSDLCTVRQNPSISGLYAVQYLDGSVWFWSIEKKLPLGIPHAGGNSPQDVLNRAIDIHWSPCGDFLFVLSRRSVRAVSVATGAALVHSVPDGHQYASFAVFGDSAKSALALGTSKGALEIVDFDHESFEATAMYEVASERIKLVRWVNGERLVLNYDQSTIGEFNSTSGELRELLTCPYIITALDCIELALD